MKSRSQLQEEKRQRRTQIIISVFLAFLMISSTIGFYFTSSSTSERYNGVKLKTVMNTQGLAQGYTAKFDGKETFFYTHPLDSIAIGTPATFAPALQSAQGIVWMFSPTDNATAVFDQLRYDFSLTIPVQQGAALTENATSGAYSGFLQGSCADASPGYLLIILRSGERSITEEDGCFVVSGGQYDWPLLRDRIIYLYYGVQEE